jgi:hypothetical protein
MIRSLLLCVLVCLPLVGCAKQTRVGEDEKQIAALPAGPVLYQRTGGIAGTDDRVVIWPDGFVQVRGKVLNSGEGWLSKDSMAQVWDALGNWSALKREYLPTTPVNDGYIIAITFDGKTVTASDLAPNLPSSFRELFAKIEKIAGDISAEPKPAP